MPEFVVTPIATSAPDHPPTGELLRLSGVVRGYGDAPVLCGIDLNVAAGQRLAIAGPSGSGKTTLLNLIGGLDRPDAGQILLTGRDLTTMKERELAVVRNQKIGFVFQSHGLLPQCTALENVLIPTLAGHAAEPPATQRSRAIKLLESVGLSERIHHRPGQLSGGQAQRVAVARALINRPALLLADEPTGALDQRTAGEMMRLLIDLSQHDGLTLIVATHSDAVMRSMDRVMELRDGRLI